MAEKTTEKTVAEPEETEKSQKLFADQFDDEEVLFVFRKHPVVMRKGLILGSLGPLLGIIPAAVRPQLGFGFFFGGLAAGFILGGLLFFPSWLAWHYSVFIVTDQRLIQITQKGLFNKSVVDLGLNHIRSVNYEVMGLQETMLGFGTIVVQTYFGELIIHDVHHPGKISKKLAEIMRQVGFTPDATPSAPEDSGY